MTETDYIRNIPTAYTKRLQISGPTVFGEIYADGVRIMCQTFGWIFRESPREKDYLNAHKWCDKQLVLLNKHASNNWENEEGKGE